MREEIFNKIREAVKEIVGTECDVLFGNVEKNNGVVLQSAIIIEPGKKVAPHIYIDEMLEMFETGSADLQDIVKEIVGIYEKYGNTEIFNNSVSDLSKEKILKNVVCQLVNKKKNEKRLMVAPHTDVLDLAVMYRVVVIGDENGIASFIVSHDLCKMYGLSLEELDAAAMENTRRQGFEVQTMASVLAEISGMTEDVYAGEEPPMYILTNRKRINGASVMLYPEEFKKLSLRLENDLYVLPSSIHEVIVVPTSKINPDELAVIVGEVNATEVSNEDFLSDSVYRYDRTDGKLKIAQGV